jgi:hypothetical protein
MFIPVNLGEAKERKPVVNGKYDVTIQEVDTESRTKEGKPQIIVSLSIGGHEMDAPNVRYFMGIPSDKDNADQRGFKILNAARFMQAFGFDSKDGIDTDALLGKSATLELVKSEPDDQGRVFNRINLPYLRDENAPKAGVAKPPKR